jgi:hypothetical protein
MSARNSVVARADARNPNADLKISPSPTHLFRVGEGGGEGVRRRRARSASCLLVPSPSPPALQRRAGEGQIAWSTGIFAPRDQTWNSEISLISTLKALCTVAQARLGLLHTHGEATAGLSRGMNPPAHTAKPARSRLLCSASPRFTGVRCLSRGLRAPGCRRAAPRPRPAGQFPEPGDAGHHQLARRGIGDRGSPSSRRRGSGEVDKVRGSTESAPRCPQICRTPEAGFRTPAMP